MAGKHSQLNEELQEKASLFAAGTLRDSELSEYVRHLDEDNCAICRKEVQELQSAISLLALDVPLETPSPAVRDRLMRQARRSATAAPPRNPRWAVWTAAISGLTTIAAGSILLVVMRDNTELRRLTGSLSSRIAQLEVQINQQRVRLAVLSSPQVRVVNLAGQGLNASATGRIFSDKSKRRWLFYTSGLAPAPAEKAYQLWFVPNTGNPVSAVVFNTAANGSVEVEIAVPDAVDMDNLKAAAVTTEPSGGLPQPGGPFALLGAW